MTPANAQLRPRGSNHVGMRQYNERVVLQALRLHGSLAKAELARQTGLTAQTIGLITTRLEEDGLILRDAPVRGRIGRERAIGVQAQRHRGLADAPAHTLLAQQQMSRA